MNVAKITDLIVKAGTVILVTVGSFIVKTPTLDPNENSGVNYQNVIGFVIGVLSVSLFRRKIEPRRAGITLGVSLVCLLSLLVCYELMIRGNSNWCGGKVRIVVSPAGFRNEEVKNNYEYWKKHSSTPLKTLFMAYRCDPKEIWTMEALRRPYYMFLGLYFLISIATCITILSTNALFNHDT